MVSGKLAWALGVRRRWGSETEGVAFDLPSAFRCKPELAEPEAHESLQP